MAWCTAALAQAAGCPLPDHPPWGVDLATLQNKFPQPHNGGQWPPPTPPARPNGWAEWANSTRGQLVHSPPTHSGQKVAKISILAQFGLPGFETGHVRSCLQWARVVLEGSSNSTREPLTLGGLIGSMGGLAKKHLQMQCVPQRSATGQVIKGLL